MELQRSMRTVGLDTTEATFVQNMLEVIGRLLQAYWTLQFQLKALDVCYVNALLISHTPYTAMFITDFRVF